MKRSQKIATGLGLALSMAFTNAVANKELKDMVPSRVLGNTDKLILLAFNTLPEFESDWKHFNKDGSPKTSKDNAIGLTQVIPMHAIPELEKSGYKFDVEKLKWDEDYNYAVGFIMYRDGAIKRRIFTQYCSELNQEVFALAYAIYHSGGKNVANAVNKHGKDWRIGLGSVGQRYVANNMKALNEQVLSKLDPSHPVFHGEDCHFTGKYTPYKGQLQAASLN